MGQLGQNSQCVEQWKRRKLQKVLKVETISRLEKFENFRYFDNHQFFGAMNGHQFEKEENEAIRLTTFELFDS